jgi:ATP-binding cassette subfamily B protein
LIVNIRIEITNARWESGASFINESASKIIIGLITFYGGYQVIKGRMTLGSLTAIMLYLHNLINLQYQFISFFETIMVGSVSCRRVSEILDERPQVIEAKDAKNLIFSRAEIIFKNISFGYRPDQYILKNMSFQIAGTAHIALIGPSGCGKTTLLNLLVRLYDPCEGKILIDGCNIKDLKFSVLKGQIGFALQEPFLWNDTIESNIRYGRQNATQEEIFTIARLSGIDDFVKLWPQGYQTIIGEDACKISEGQKQKIAIARALIKKPKILILDEAMSSMDSASEEKIISNIKSVQKDLTLIIVSHRLSTVMSADLGYYFFKPDEMIIDNPRNLCESNKEFNQLFIGQDRILI